MSEDPRDRRADRERDGVPGRARGVSGQDGRVPRRGRDARGKAKAALQAAKKTWRLFVLAGLLASALLVMALAFDAKVIERQPIIQQQKPGPTRTIVQHDVTHNERVTVVPTPGPTITRTASPSPSPSARPHPNPSPSPTPTCRRIPLLNICTSNGRAQSPPGRP